MTSAQENPATNGGDRDARLKSLYSKLDEKNMAPYWAVDSDNKNNEDGQVLKARKAVPHIWRYQDIEPILYESAELITMDDSERRSVVLVNPGLAPVRATVTTLYVAYRLNDPHEIMPPHKHSINAVRIGLTGKSNYTGIEGEDVVFGPGDLVLTPSGAWHNHGNRGAEFAVNVSVLDLPLSEVLNSASFDHDYTEEQNGERVSKREQTSRFPEDYSNRVYGHGGLRPRFVNHHRGNSFASPMYVYRWDQTRELLDQFRDHDGDPHEAIMVEYIDPTTGRPPYPTMTFFGQMLRPGERTLPLLQNASQVCIPFEGSGYSIIDGQRFDWRKFDAMAVPGGTWCQHVNESTDEAILFVASDEPTLKTLGFYQKHGKTTDGEIIRIE